MNRKMKAEHSNTSFWRLLAVAVLGFFGVSCGEAIDEDLEILRNARAMYGCPTADYSVKETVTDQDGNPIKGIIIKCLSDPNYSSVTSASGEFIDNHFGTDKPVYVFEDPDGPENGGMFARDTTRGADLYVVRKGTDNSKNPFGHTSYDATVTKKLKKVIE